MRRKTPLPIRRKLRKESGFGCCFCGNPIIQYHHILDWAVENHHDPKKMMTVCIAHHDMCTQKAISIKDQYAAKNSPFNIENGLLRGKLTTAHSVVFLKSGIAEFINYHTLFSIDGHPVLSIKNIDGQIFINLNLIDEQGKTRLVIEENEWLTGTTGNWDIEASYGKLIIRNAQREILVDLNIKSLPFSLYAQLYRGDSSFVFGRDVFEARKNENKFLFRIEDLTVIGAHFNIDTNLQSITIKNELKGGIGVSVQHLSDKQSGVVFRLSDSERLRSGLDSLLKLQTKIPKIK